MSFLVATLAASALLAAPAATAPGGSVSAFAGRVLSFRTDDVAFGVAIQGDGRIIAAGWSRADFALARYNANGSLDPSFGPRGKVQTDFGAGESASGVAIQGDGRIIAAGGIGADFALARYNADGNLDPSFGSEGKVWTDFDRRTDFGAGIAIQGDDRIVVVGTSGRHFALARYNADGSLDPSFGSGGKVLTDFDRRNDGARAVAIQADGRIVVGGRSGYDFALARYNADGSLDPSFGSGGKVRTDFGGGMRAEFVEGIAIQGDGKIIAVGWSGSTADFALARYNLDGSLDPSFGAGGKVLTDLGGDDVATGVAIQSDGRIVAAGGSWVDDEYFALARYNADGSLDPSFGSGGKVQTDIGSYEGASAVAIQGDGRIVAAGSYEDAAELSDFALARYNADGSLDPSFGSGGKVRTDFARIVSLSATRSRNGVRVRWRTASEYGTRGFNIYRQDGRPPRANRKLVPSKGSATRGASYSFLDRRAPRRRVKYRLQEVRRDGALVWYGPIALKRLRQ